MSSSTHPQGMIHDRSNLRHLLQPNSNSGSNNNPVYIQTGPGQYQAVQPHLAQQFQNRFPGQQQIRFGPQPAQMRMLVPNQQSRMPVQQRPPQYPSSGGGAKWHIPQQSSTSNVFITEKKQLILCFSSSFCK